MQCTSKKKEQRKITHTHTPMDDVCLPAASLNSGLARSNPQLCIDQPLASLVRGKRHEPRTVRAEPRAEPRLFPTKKLKSGGRADAHAAHTASHIQARVVCHPPGKEHLILKPRF